MKKLNFMYKVRYSFSQPVTDHCYALRIIPETNEEQGIYASGYSISGGSSACMGRDGFGNLLLSGRIAQPHDGFAFRVYGTAYVDRTRTKMSRREAFYRYPTELTGIGPELNALYEANVDRIHSNLTSLERAVGWLQVVSGAIAYESGITDIYTSAERALSGGRGVCQDYAHILIALLRMDKIPARYIAGFLLGEGATHAWVEADCGGRWIGLDPTHGCCLTDDYIEVARGRDYRDCIMDRGNFKGFAQQEQEVFVRVSAYEPEPVEPFGIL